MVAWRFSLLVCLLLTPLDVWAQDSLNTSVVGHLDSYPAYSDIWGYETQSGTHYAILGTQNGTSIVDVTTPSSPSEVLFVPGPASAWRDMKTHAGYAYLVTEGGGGMQVVNLETTPPQLVTTYTSTFTSAHNIVISDGFAYAVGAGLIGGVGTRVLDLADPENPVEVGSFNGFYIHDAIVRNDTMYAAAINNDLIGAIDFTNKAAPVLIDTWTWQGSNAHNCDLTADGNYLLTTDETTGGDLHIFDVRDLSNVIQVATYSANSAAIIHNVLIEGDFAYISYYTEGVRILDIANPELPVEVGFYDTFPGASGGFNGCWGVYPHASTGLIYASDIQTGLYIFDFDLPWGAVQGTVTEQGVGTPLEATVSILGGNTSETNSTTGAYKVYGDPGVATVVTTSFGFAPDTSMVALTQGVVTPHDVTLVRVGNNSFLGNVISAADSMPIESVSLILDGTPLFELSDGNGDYLFANVPYGVYSLELSRFGFTPVRQTVTVSNLDALLENRQDFVMQPSALVEDFEMGPAGWTVGGPDDNATTGIWVWADPVGSGGGAVQPEDDHSDPGSLCWVTGNAANASQSIGTNDVDNGRTTLTTPIFDASAIPNATISYWRWFSNDASVVTPDTLRVDISSDGFTWIPVERLVTSAPWTKVTIRVADYVAPTFLTRMRFAAEDIGAGSIVESAIDDFMVFEGSVITETQNTPFATRLLSNYPNPFNPSTTLRYELATPARVQLRIYDIRGRLVKAYPTRQVGAGLHREIWNGVDDQGRLVATGVYLYEMVTPERRESRRMHLLK